MVKAKLYFLLLLYIKKEPKLQNFQEPTSASTKYLRKQLSLILTETKIQVKTVRWFDPFPELICLGFKHTEHETFKSSVPSAREGRKTYCILHCAHCRGPLVKFYSALNSVSWEQLFIKGMDNSIDCYKFD